MSDKKLAEAILLLKKFIDWYPETGELYKDLEVRFKEHRAEILNFVNRIEDQGVRNDVN